MTVLVLGATGLQGGAVLRHLRGRGLPLRALTRHPQSQAARRLAQTGVEVVQGDMADPASLGRAFVGVRRAFSVQDFYAPGVGIEGELAQARTVFSAARQAGVEHVVQSVMGDGNAPGGPPHFLSKALIERDLRASGLGYTLLGTVWFMENLLNPAMKPALTFPVLRGGLNADTVFPMLAAEDLGRVAAQVLTDPAPWAGRKLNLAGDALTVEQMARAYRAATGRAPRRWRIAPSILRRLTPEFAAQIDWHNRVNMSFGPAELRGILPDALNFARFLQTRPVPRL
ncbi:MAG: NmrA/HSCARG family protein [Paracoccaceae bacterium]